MNTETKLYLSLKAVMNEVETNEHHNKNLGVVNSAAFESAGMALALYELDLGPLPDWAIAHNVGCEFVLGTQLYTLNGRRHGNAHIVGMRAAELWADARIDVLTDAGSFIENLSWSEVEGGWEAGNFISDPKAVWERFGKNTDMSHLLEPDE